MSSLYMCIDLTFCQPGMLQQQIRMGVGPLPGHAFQRLPLAHVSAERNVADILIRVRTML